MIFYVVRPSDRGFVEVAQVRENGSCVSEAETGTIYPSFREAERGVFVRNGGRPELLKASRARG